MKLKFIKLVFSLIILMVLFNNCKTTCHTNTYNLKYKSYSIKRKNHPYIKWGEHWNKNPYRNYYTGRIKKATYRKTPYYMKW